MRDVGGGAWPCGIGFYACIAFAVLIPSGVGLGVEREVEEVMVGA